MGSHRRLTGTIPALAPTRTTPARITPLFLSSIQNQLPNLLIRSQNSSLTRRDQETDGPLVDQVALKLMEVWATKEPGSDAVKYASNGPFPVGPAWAATFADMAAAAVAAVRADQLAALEALPQYELGGNGGPSLTVIDRHAALWAITEETHHA